MTRPSSVGSSTTRSQDTAAAGNLYYNVINRFVLVEGADRWRQVLRNMIAPKGNRRNLCYRTEEQTDNNSSCIYCILISYLFIVKFTSLYVCIKFISAPQSLQQRPPNPRRLQQDGAPARPLDKQRPPPNRPLHLTGASLRVTKVGSQEVKTLHICRPNIFLTMKVGMFGLENLFDGKGLHREMFGRHMKEYASDQSRILVVDLSSHISLTTRKCIAAK